MAHDAVVAAGAVEVGIGLGAAVTYLAGSNHEPTVAPTGHAHRPSLRHSAAGTRNGPGGLLLPQVPFQPPKQSLFAPPVTLLDAILQWTPLTSPKLDAVLPAAVPAGASP